METILYSDMIRKPVEKPNQRANSKLVEIVAHRGDKHWYANEVKIESGIIDKEGAYYPVSTLEGIGDDTTFMLKPKERGRLKPKKPDSFFLSGLMKKKVVDKSGEEIGRIYDFELYVGRSPWIVWKILINPTGLKPTKKRLRIPTQDVSKISSDKVTLKTELP